MPDNLTLFVYLFIVCLPFLFFWLAYKNKKKFNKYRCTGRIPDIEAASRGYSAFMALGVLSTMGAIFFFVNFAL